MFAFSDSYDRSSRYETPNTQGFKYGDLNCREFKMLNFFSSNMTVKEEMEIFYEVDGKGHGYTFEYLRLPEDINEAEYQGRKVKLGKPMQGDIKKFKVYVKNPAGNVVKVNFGHGGTSVKGKAMRIRKSNPDARKNFRARHNCDTPGPRHKARYWSCRKW